MRNAWIWIVLVVLGLGGVMLWWQNSRNAAVTTPAAPVENVQPAQPAGSEVSATQPEAAAPTTPAASATVREIAVTNKGFEFNPKTISVKKGEKVKITYTNGGGTHDFRIEGYDVGTKVIQGSASETFEFVADKAGDFEFYCSVGSHRAMGMKGTFTVTE